MKYNFKNVLYLDDDTTSKKLDINKKENENLNFDSSHYQSQTPNSDIESYREKRSTKLMMPFEH